MSAMFLLCLGNDANAQITINKSVNVSTAYVGNTVTYTIQYSYLSTTDPFLLNASITDQVPTGLQNVAVSSALGTINFNPVTNMATISFGDLPAGTTGDVVITGVVATSAPPNSVLTNQATLSGTNGSATSNQVQTTVLASAGVSMYKLLMSPGMENQLSTLIQGESASYGFFIANGGNTPLSNACFSDALPNPDKLVVTSIGTGVWNNPGSLTTANIEYTTNLNGAWTPLSGSPFNVNVNSVVTPSLASGEYITQVRWCFNGDMPVGMGQGTPAPRINITAAADTPLGDKTNCINFVATGVNVLACVDFEVIETITTSVPGVNKYGSAYSLAIRAKYRFYLRDRK
ncbi:MAG: DUF11 domain-containing protein [Sphingobacteriales bacterium]|nr:DUF11 domain-containing protein [Sphingobacteriales bacterium]